MEKIMHIDDVIKNLENTIQGKELLLKSIRARPVRNADAELVVDVSSHYNKTVMPLSLDMGM